jgi:hypothetical protein
MSVKLRVFNSMRRYLAPSRASFEGMLHRKPSKRECRGQAGGLMIEFGRHEGWANTKRRYWQPSERSLSSPPAFLLEKIPWTGRGVLSGKPCRRSTSPRRTAEDSVFSRRSHRA